MIESKVLHNVADYGFLIESRGPDDRSVHNGWAELRALCDAANESGKKATPVTPPKSHKRPSLASTAAGLKPSKKKAQRKKWHSNKGGLTLAKVV